MHERKAWKFPGFSFSRLQKIGFESYLDELDTNKSNVYVLVLSFLLSLFEEINLLRLF